MVRRIPSSQNKVNVLELIRQRGGYWYVYEKTDGPQNVQSDLKFLYFARPQEPPPADLSDVSEIKRGRSYRLIGIVEPKSGEVIRY